MRTARTLLYTAFVLALATACATRETADVAPEPVGDDRTEVAIAPTGEHDATTIDTIEITGSRLRDAEAEAGRGNLAQRADEERREVTASDAAASVAEIGTLAPPPPPMSVAPPMPMARMVAGAPGYQPQPGTIGPVENTENYSEFDDNGIVRTAENPVSTFSIDVDTGSYSNVRRMLAQGQLPPKDAVRVEEMLNYFDYGYAGPGDRSEPFAVSTELAPSPWDAKRVLMHVGIQGYDVDRSQIPPANLVFLLDTSGSMADADKLPLLKESLRQLVPQLRAQDRVSIVVYAGSAGLVLAPTPGDRHEEILQALDRLEAGGSTNGGEGIELAYTMAQQAFIRGGVNRIVLATDGDFNVGISDQQALETRVARGRESGVALTTLGFGQGNYNDAMAEQLADVGNGNHAYIDSAMEARKVLVEEMGSTLLTIASDVKIQIEFNPAQVAEYRLVGYENRALAREDFNNDRIDAGEIGAGHDVTAIYELCLVGSGCESSDALRYRAAPTPAPRTAEIAHLKLRYKLPGQADSVLMQRPVQRSEIRAQASENLRFAAAVAAYADLLRGGTHVGGFTWEQVELLAQGAQGADTGGYRGEFLRLVARARSLSAPSAAGSALISQE